jgi:hypothetical protein
VEPKPGKSKLAGLFYLLFAFMGNIADAAIGLGSDICQLLRKVSCFVSDS